MDNRCHLGFYKKSMPVEMKQREDNAVKLYLICVKVVELKSNYSYLKCTFKEYKKRFNQWYILTLLVDIGDEFIVESLVKG